MYALIAILALSQTPQHRLVLQPNLPRARIGAPLFEFAPASGAGMTAPCACTSPTTATGQALTFARASNGTCIKGNTVAVVDGDMVTCSSGQPRVMAGGNGSAAVGVLVEGARTNDCLRSAELCDALAWIDVGTPSCSSNVAPGPLGTTTMDSITDNDAAAFEGRSQLIAVTSQNLHAVSCYVKSSTATSASITMVGVGNSAGDCTGTVTGLSSVTSTRVSCGSPTLYGAGLTAVVIAIRVGTAVGDTGVLLVEACQHEVAPVTVPQTGATSYIATAAAPVPRAADKLSVAALPWTAATNSFSFHVILPWLAPNATGFRLVFDANNRFSTSINTATWRTNYVVAGAGNVQLTPTTATALTEQVVAGYYDGARVGGCLNGVCAQSSQAFALPTGTGELTLGSSETPSLSIDGVIKQFCLDPSPARCL